MITKLIILFIIVWAGLRIYHTIQNKKPGSVMKKDARDMVSCEKCGIHIPVDEAVKNNGKYFCSQDHIDRDI
ncbi:MAG: PP0621 family protein [Arenicellales bacterium]